MAPRDSRTVSDVAREQRTPTQKARDDTRARILRQGAIEAGNEARRNQRVSRHQSIGSSLSDVGSELISPLRQFGQHPGFQTGVGAAAAFPWGTRMRAPKQWDLASGQGTVQRFTPPAYPEELGPPVREYMPLPELSPNDISVRYRAHDLGGNYLGSSSLGIWPDATSVDWIGMANPNMGTMIDLLAPAINRARVHGAPIDAFPVNPHLSQVMLKMSQRNPGMFTPNALEVARQTLHQMPYTTGFNSVAEMAAARRRNAQSQRYPQPPRPPGY